MLELIERIRQHKLGNKDEAFSLYFTLCNYLQEKYGLVDRNYDENPTRRGKDWLDIHHILEYELDDIARRTKNALYFERLRQEKTKNEIQQAYDSYYSIEELKNYNVREQLVYANKIEHFLLHYLIESVRGKNVFSGGPNYLWDCSVALDLYGFDEEYMNILKKQKDFFYSTMSSKEVTLLYKKLINWKGWNIYNCSRFWTKFSNIKTILNERQISYIENKEKFFKLFNLLNFQLEQKIVNAIKNSEYKVKTFEATDGSICKEISRHIFKEDGKTVILFNDIFERKSFTIPYFVEGIAVGAFDRTYHLETIIIPTTVKFIENRAFIEQKIKTLRCAPISKIVYKGTKTEWDKKFSNVMLTGITLICKKSV